MLAMTRFGCVRVWEVASGRELGNFRARDQWPGDSVGALAFSPDNRVVASAGLGDYSILLWDVTGRWAGGKDKQAELSREAFGRLWEEVASPDASRAYAAVWRLVDSRRKAVAYLGENLHPQSPVSGREIGELIRALDSDRFDVRQTATQQLIALGDLAEPRVRATLAGRPSPEARRRLTQALHEMNRLRWRVIRAVASLEKIGSPEAQAVLEALCQGAPEALLTREAKAALERLTGLRR
jgi:hypothetical protein